MSDCWYLCNCTFGTCWWVTAGMYVTVNLLHAGGWLLVCMWLYIWYMLVGDCWYVCDYICYMPVGDCWYICDCKFGTRWWVTAGMYLTVHLVQAGGWLLVRMWLHLVQAGGWLLVCMWLYLCYMPVGDCWYVCDCTFATCQWVAAGTYVTVHLVHAGGWLLVQMWLHLVHAGGWLLVCMWLYICYMPVGDCWYICDCTFATCQWVTAGNVCDSTFDTGWWVTAGALRTVVRADMKQWALVSLLWVVYIMHVVDRP